MNDEHGPHCEGCQILGLMAERDAAEAMLSRLTKERTDGTPEHLRMGLTKNGDGPVPSEDDPDFDHWGCWCGTPGCDNYVTAPWDDPAGCFGHCDREGWYAPCTNPKDGES